MHGVGGGTHGPSNIYHPLAKELLKDDISSLLIDCRYDSDLDECISDVLACVDYLDREQGINKTGLIGWSFGGAVVISAAAEDQRIKAVITVASQSYGTDRVDEISPRPVLLIHGTADPVLTYRCSMDIYRRAGEVRQIALFQEDDHGISKHKEEMFKMVKKWFVENLK